MSVGGIYCGRSRNMLANRSNSDTFGPILCVLDFRGLTSSGFGEILGLEWVVCSCFFFFGKP